MTTEEKMIQELKDTYAAYIDVFNREDVEGFVRCYSHPHAMLSRKGELIVVNTKDDHLKMYQQVMTSLRERGWGRSGTDLVRITPFTESLAQLVAGVTRYKKDGSVLENLRACYMFRREENGWKIASLAQIDAPFAGPVGG